jgi:hypothetical protein
MRATHLPNPHKLRTLLLYGHRQTADTLGQLLAVCGQEVLVAYEGSTACDLAPSYRPDVIFLDLQTEGEEVARRLRDYPELRDTALVAITGGGQEEAAVAAEENTFTHYLVEPVDPAQVLGLLKKLRTHR